MSRVFASLVALVLIPSLAPAQVRRFPPPRDQAAPAVGTSRVRGRIVAADNGQPLRRAQVRIQSAELRESRVTTTDAEGRYEFRELPAGRYSLMASKGSFVTLNYGQTRPLQQGRPLQVGDNQTLEKIDFALPRGSVITGRVVDEFGEPVANAQAMPMRFQYVQGQRRPMPAGGMAMTNDIGEFRLFGLPPGQYYVSISLRMEAAMNDTSDDRTGYAATYYPGTPSLAEAQPIAVGVGETVSGITVSLVPTKTARITGSVVSVEGQPVRAGMVTVIQQTGNMFTMASGGGQIRPDGSFTISNLAPGEYTLRAMSGPGMMGPGVTAAPATATVTVNGEDITGVLLVPPRISTVTGRVIVPPAPDNPLNPSTIRINAMPMTSNLIMPMQPATVNDDYTFELKAAPGTTIIRAFAAGAGAEWVLKKVHQDGVDVTDQGITIQSGQAVEGVEVELTNTPPEVSGLVTDARGDAVKDYSILLFAQDRERWAGPTRYTATARPDQDGRFKVRTLPPGQYFAVALEYFDPSERENPEFLDSVIDHATRFSLGDAEAKVLNLKIVTPE